MNRRRFLVVVCQTHLVPYSHYPPADSARRITASPRAPRGYLISGALVCLSFGLFGCDRWPSSKPEANSTIDAGASVVATVATTVPSAFCAAISNLSDVRQDLTNDYASQAEYFASIYEAHLNDLPELVRPDFEIVIATLRANATRPADSTLPDIASSPENVTSPEIETSAASDVTGYLIDSTPVERVNEYITSTCTGAGNDPAPDLTTTP